ncbi:uncharacterized protein [Dysidea avara]|uniref:uncharacterized protein n=1 Tax=Dysidea avara TaxID=196820 RepID=UPI003320CB27
MADGEIKKILQDLRRNQLDIILRLEAIEDKLGAGAPRAPEPILTCVQCQEEYKESQNAEGYCKYHPSPLQGAGWDYIFRCCNQKSRNFDAAKLIPGCKKGKHCSEHHENYTYAAYTTFMMDTVRKSLQVWLEVDVADFVSPGCKWAEVGLSEDNKVYIACGENRIRYNGIKLFSMEQLKEYTNEGSSVVLKKTSDTGWSIKGSVVVAEGPVVAIEVSVKPASSSQVTAKRAILNLTGTVPALDRIEDMSTSSQKTTTSYTLPEDVTEGPVIDVGEDYSKNRKTDYKTETDEGCTLQLQQKGDTKADSNLRAQDGKWNNLFTATLIVTNSGDGDLAITNVEGYYCTGNDGTGDWVKCDDAWIGVESYRDYRFLDTPNFNIESAKTGTLAVRLNIKIPGTPPSSGPSARRAHKSLPQPLHLKAVFTDQKDRKASIRFEFGNSPLDISTREMRESSWAKGGLYSYCFADNVENSQRSDAAIYFQSNDGILCYRPAIEGVGSNIYYIGSKMGEFAYQAKQAGKEEFEIEDFAKTKEGTELRAYALVDLENEIAYGFKMMIKTPTSLTSTHCLLPQPPDPSTMSLTMSPESVKAGNEITIKWQVARASKGDHIYVYPQYGKKNIDKMYEYNKQALLTGEVTMKAPSTAGVYEVRYYPSSLSSSTTGYYHDVYWLNTKFTVVQS